MKNLSNQNLSNIGYIFEDEPNDWLSLTEASDWASNFLKKKVSKSNISYLLQYGRIEKVIVNGNVYVSVIQLKEYYKKFLEAKKYSAPKRKGEQEIQWALSFDGYKESETTKHLHRLHPYKGKFIPQLVEFFLDDHTDEIKKEIYFEKGDIVLDPFCGSGTTLVQANELGIHAVGVDVSYFNAFIAEVKTSEINADVLKKTIFEITSKFYKFIASKNYITFEKNLNEALTVFNKEFFPSPKFKIQVATGKIDEITYGQEQEKKTQRIYEDLLKYYDIDIKHVGEESFLNTWLFPTTKKEAEFILNEIYTAPNDKVKNCLLLILSRTVRSCRVTSHSDLATLAGPIYCPYYCYKHKKICKPLFSMFSWWRRYSEDTLKRFFDFSNISTATYQTCFVGDSRSINIESKIATFSKPFKKIYSEKKIKGIFTSPPYLGLIDYHEQHAYAYELFKFKRQDALEIGSLQMGSGMKAKEKYVESISEVLLNCRKFLVKKFHIFIVANDKYNLYEKIAKKSKLKIAYTFKRPVLNRTEKGKGKYHETIFYLTNE